MLISTKGRYALRVMIDLAEQDRDGYHVLMDIAKRQEISEKYLESIIAILSKAGFVQAQRGRGGGYRLSREPQSYTVGSNEFYQNYAAKNNICCLLDNGHYHPLEYVSDKIPALLAFYDKVALHVTRGVRWDSDHVVLFEDELKEIAKEIVRNEATDKVMIGLDYFDASINRLSAWVTGQRAMQKALLYALLMNHDELKKLQDEADFTALMVKGEEYKTLPFGAVWSEYLKRENLSEDYLTEIKKYEKEVLSKR